jgi:tetratricopeptide (TPR) repeat protein
MADLPDIDSLWAWDDPAESERRFGALLAPARSTRDACYLGQLLTQLARTQGLQGRFEEAHRTLDEAQQVSAGDPLVRVRYLLERGRVFNSSGRPDEARPLFLEALRLAAERSEEFYAADAAHMLGIVGPPEQQLAWSLRALEIAERSADARTRTWLGPLYNNVGWTYHDLGRHAEALGYFQKGLAYRQEAGESRETRVAAWTVGRALRSLGRHQEALAVQRVNLRNAEVAGHAPGFIEEEIAECLRALGNAKEARPHFVRAYESLSSDAWLSEHEPERLARLKRLAGGS